MLVDALLLANDYLKLTSYIEGPSRFWKVRKWTSSCVLEQVGTCVDLLPRFNTCIIVSICDARASILSITTSLYLNSCPVTLAEKLKRVFVNIISFWPPSGYITLSIWSFVKICFPLVYIQNCLMLKMAGSCENLAPTFWSDIKNLGNVLVGWYCVEDHWNCRATWATTGPWSRLANETKTTIPGTSMWC